MVKQDQKWSIDAISIPGFMKGFMTEFTTGFLTGFMTEFVIVFTTVFMTVFELRTLDFELQTDGLFER